MLSPAGVVGVFCADDQEGKWVEAVGAYDEVGCGRLSERGREECVDGAV